jgi:2-polyprenyl-3-methyl-5-hydroxy-6-metoxy-1,4-benzoquinol methylase
MTRARRYFEWQYQLANSKLGKRVLEIGAGIGNFTQYLLERELVVAIDVQPECIAQLQRRFSDRINLISKTMDAEDPEFLSLKVLRIDSIACLNVLEHVKNDDLLLLGMGEILPPGGKVVLILPAFQALYGPIDRNLGHYRRYSKRLLAEKAAHAGLAPKILRYMNSVGAIGWWVNAKLLRMTEQSESQIAFFDSAIVPVLSRLEEAVHPPFGQSLFAVLEKPSA